MKEHSLEKIFADFKPDLGDSTRYMEELDRKLEAVEHLKECYRIQRRKTRIAAAIAFLAGMILGGIALIFSTTHHIAIPDAGSMKIDMETVVIFLGIAAITVGIVFSYLSFEENR